MRQGLREAIRVDLGLTEMPAAVPAKLREYALLESGTLQERPVTGSVQQIFEQSGRQLLILGEPGAGKTNLMLKLAESLVKQAKNEPAFPISIVFSLPRCGESMVPRCAQGARLGSTLWTGRGNL